MADGNVGAIVDDDRSGGVIASNDDENDDENKAEVGEEGEDEEEVDDSWKDADFLSFDASQPRSRDDDDENDAVAGGGGSRNGPAAPSFADATTNRGRGRPELNQPLPPWMDAYPAIRTGFRRVPPLVVLHNEIVDFARLMMPTEDEAKSRNELVEEVTKIAKGAFGETECEVVVFGSQATGLFLPSSDIDLVIRLPPKDESTAGEKAARGATGEEKAVDDGGDDGNHRKESTLAQQRKEMDEWDPTTASSSVGSPLQRLAAALRETWSGDDELTYLEVIENTRVPLVKFTHGPTNLSFDVCFDQAGGPESADLMHRFIEAMPPLRPLIFVLKYFMQSRGLNEPYHGGIGSFLLQMMLVSFLQHREREEYNAGRTGLMNLGALLLEFFELYGIDFNYVTTGISVRADGFYFAKGAKDRREYFWQPSRPFSLAVEHPLEPTSDVGRGTYRMQLIQRSFEVAFRTLLAHVSEPIQPAVSILATIVPPTEEMSKRAVLQKALNIEKMAAAAGLEGALRSGRDMKDGKGKKRSRSRQSRSSNDSSMSMSSDDEFCGRRKKQRHRNSNGGHQGGDKRKRKRSRG